MLCTLYPCCAEITEVNGCIVKQHDMPGECGRVKVCFFCAGAELFTSGRKRKLGTNRKWVVNVKLCQQEVDRSADLLDTWELPLKGQGLNKIKLQTSLRQVFSNKLSFSVNLLSHIKFNNWQKKLKLKLKKAARVAGCLNDFLWRNKWKQNLKCTMQPYFRLWHMH